MSIPVNPLRLRHELARRALSAGELARLSGLSAATVTAALCGRPIAEKSLRLIASALAEVPCNAQIDTLLTSGGDLNVLA